MTRRDAYNAMIGLLKEYRPKGRWTGLVGGVLGPRGQALDVAFATLQLCAAAEAGVEPTGATPTPERAAALRRLADALRECDPASCRS